MRSTVKHMELNVSTKSKGDWLTVFLWQDLKIKTTRKRLQPKRSFGLTNLLILNIST